jgi:2'-5' RNA ligase
MTRLAVVAYPHLRDSDRQWVEAVRARHDPQASQIEAHFTLVFPAEVAVEALIAQVRSAVVFCGAIPFTLGRAVVFRDVAEEGSHVFLLPEEGHEELHTLHDRLNDGVFSRHLRTDVPFVPHLTVGAYSTFEECERVAEQLNQEQRTMRGTVRSVDVIEVAPLAVRTVVVVPFGQDAASRPTTG